jgi:hypothetical protein
MRSIRKKGGKIKARLFCMNRNHNKEKRKFDYYILEGFLNGGEKKCG